MSRYVVAFRFEDEGSADMYYRAANRFAIERENAFVFTDRGAAEVIAAQTGGEVEELPEPAAPPSEMEAMLAVLHTGHVRERVFRACKSLEMKIENIERAITVKSAKGTTLGTRARLNAKIEAYLDAIDVLKKALR